MRSHPEIVTPMPNPHLLLAPGASGTIERLHPHRRALVARGIEVTLVALPKGQAERAVPIYAAALEAAPPGVAIGGHSFGGRVASLLRRRDAAGRARPALLPAPCARTPRGLGRADRALAADRLPRAPPVRRGRSVRPDRPCCAPPSPAFPTRSSTRGRGSATACIASSMTRWTGSPRSSTSGSRRST